MTGGKTKIVSGLRLCGEVLLLLVFVVAMALVFAVLDVFV